MSECVLTTPPLCMFRGLVFDGVPSQPTPITMRSIAQDVADLYGVTVADLKSVSRSRRHAFPRHEAFWRCRLTGRYSYPQIGRFFGDRDHSTVIHGERRHKQRIGLANG